MRVAVVDDCAADAGLLVEHLRQFEKEKGIPIEIDEYHASLEFLEQYKSQYEVLFLDIEMPGTDGMEAAREIRRKDSTVGIIFITNMVQYAIQGYEVGATAFMVKPVSYFNLANKIEKAYHYASQRSRKELLVNSDHGLVRVTASELLYLEKDRDYLVYHTAEGELRAKGTIKVMRQELEGLPFDECTVGCLVNLAYVRRIDGDSVYLRNAILPLSRRQKKGFTQSYIDYIGGY